MKLWVECSIESVWEGASEDDKTANGVPCDVTRLHQSVLYLQNAIRLYGTWVTVILFRPIRKVRHYVQICYTEFQFTHSAWLGFCHSPSTQLFVMFVCLCTGRWDKFDSPPPMTQQPLVGQGLRIIEASRSHSVGLLWTSDKPVAETSTCSLINDYSFHLGHPIVFVYLSFTNTRTIYYVINTLQCTEFRTNGQ
jgi:hypothetical protein